MEVVIGAVGLFVEERFAVPGDILWGGVALAAVGGIVALYSPEIITWLRKITSPRIIGDYPVGASQQGYQHAVVDRHRGGGTQLGCISAGYTGSVTKVACDV